MSMQILSWRFECAQELINSIVQDPDRLLGHWFNRSLIPGSNSVYNTLKTLIHTLIENSVHLKIELNETSHQAIKGSLHLFEDPNFAINLDMLTSHELKCFSVVVAPQPSQCFDLIYKNASTNTKIFRGAKQLLSISDLQRLHLVEKACYHSLYMCKHTNSCNFLQLKDMIANILLDILSNCKQSMVKDLTLIYKKMCGEVMQHLDDEVHHSPSTPRLKESIYGPEPLRRSRNKSDEPRNYFLGNDWFNRAYMIEQ